MVNATMAPPAFTVPGFQSNLSQLQILHAMQQAQLASPLTCNPMKQSAFNFVSPSHIRATRDVVSALQQCPDLLAQPDFAFMREFIREARCIGMSTAQQQGVPVLNTPMLVPLTEAAPLPPMRACPTHLTVETSMNDDTCSPNSQMDVDINALLQALDINDEFSSSSSTCSDPSTPILTTSQSLTFPTTPTTVGIYPQQLPVTTTAPVVVAQAQPQQVVVPQQQAAPGQTQGQCQDAATAAALAAAEAERQKAIIDPRKYKTRMCRNWLREGRCSYEHTCCFAHGEGELRNAAANITVLSSLGYFTAKQAENGQPIPSQQPAAPQAVVPQQQSQMQPQPPQQQQMQQGPQNGSNGQQRRRQ